MATATSRRLPQSATTAPPTARRLSLADVTTKGHNLPGRYVIYAVEGWGKTSLGAHFPSPIFIQSRGETGLETLIDAGLLSDVPHFPHCMAWSEVVSALEALTSEQHNHKTLVIDCLNGLERLLHEEVCHRDFGDDWGERGFGGYQRGIEVSLADWRGFLSRLDTLRETRRMTIVCLCHLRIKTFKSPLTADYDKYQVDMNDKTYALTARWGDAILFGNFETFVDSKDPKKKGKAVGQNRMLYCEHHAGYDAKNRFGLVSEIEMGNTPDEAWTNFSSAVLTARKANTNNIKQEEVANNG